MHKISIKEEEVKQLPKLYGTGKETASTFHRSKQYNGSNRKSTGWDRSKRNSSSSATCKNQNCHPVMTDSTKD
ncbi:Uncharacterized protein TCM_020362 [Theobroma cacao]|uniref:Uncharacterized protein n=1 Tax=Theobroma cacao TaxID=3641 RepID=A0A061EKZ4_THECC|nr:Uncharacterized protein TCM_020362 [Theobroma cacao]